MTERLHQHAAIEQQACALRPVVGLKYDVAIHPRDFAAVLRQSLQCHVEQPLLLPQDVAPAAADENLRILVTQLEIPPVRQLDRQQRQLKRSRNSR